MEYIKDLSNKTLGTFITINPLTKKKIRVSIGYPAEMKPHIIQQLIEDAIDRVNGYK